MLRKLTVIMGLSVIFALTSASVFASGYTLASKDTSKFIIRLCDNPSPAEGHAADELQRFLQEITGVKLPIQQAGVLPRYAILVGRDAACNRLVPKVDWSKLGDEGFVVATVGSRLLLAGGQPRGTLYAVYSFLQEELGCRWFTSDANLIPKQDPLIIPRINRTFVPKLEYRELCDWPGAPRPWGAKQFLHLEWATRNFLNGQNVYPETPSPKILGGRVIYAGGPGQSFAHTFYMLLPPAENFAKHPEWYTWRPEGSPGYGMKYDPALGAAPGTEGVDYVREVINGVQGERYWQKTDSLPGQLCLTAPGIIPALTEKVRQWLRANPSAKIVSVSQNDGGDKCLCPICKAKDMEEGGPSPTDPLVGNPSGTMIWFINQVADNIKDEFPSVAVDTFAYSYTRQPPTKTNPRLASPNVVIRLCTSGACCTVHPYADPNCAWNNGSQINHFGQPNVAGKFDEMVKTWSTICRRLYVWDYVNSIFNYLIPKPDLRGVLGPNIKFFVDHGVKGMFSQSAYTSAGTESSELRHYLIARLLWNPNFNADAARDEFLNFYYGPAAPPIRAYLLSLQDKVRDDNIHVGLFPGYNPYPGEPNSPPNSNDDLYLARPILSAAWELFDKAEELAAADKNLSMTDRSKIRKRVRTARLPLQFAALTRGPAWDTQGAGSYRTITGASPVPWINKELVEQFLAAAAEAEITRKGEGDGYAPFRDNLITQYGIDKKIIFTENPAGVPASAIKDGAVQCTARAQYLIYPSPSTVTYVWTAADGRFEDTGTVTSSLQNPRWIADVTIPDGDKSIPVLIQVTVSCGSETPNTASYLQRVVLPHPGVSSVGTHDKISTGASSAHQ